MSAMNSGLASSLYYSQLFQQFMVLLLQDEKTRSSHLRHLDIKKASVRRESQSRLNLAREYINCNLDKALQLEDLSRVAMLSPFYFVCNFKLVYKTSPHKYIVSRKINKARFLLKDSEDPLETIMKEVGYTDKSSFS